MILFGWYQMEDDASNLWINVVSLLMLICCLVLQSCVCKQMQKEKFLWRGKWLFITKINTGFVVMSAGEQSDTHIDCNLH